jgi:hypothetical protein
VPDGSRGADVTLPSPDLAGFVTVDPFVADGGYTHL